MDFSTSFIFESTTYKSVLMRSANIHDHNTAISYEVLQHRKCKHGKLCRMYIQYLVAIRDKHISGKVKFMPYYSLNN